jgi:hypothetical protein
VTEFRDWFEPYTPVVETPQEEDPFNQTLRVQKVEQQ